MNEEKFPTGYKFKYKPDVKPYKCRYCGCNFVDSTVKIITFASGNQERVEQIICPICGALLYQKEERVKFPTMLKVI